MTTDNVVRLDARQENPESIDPIHQIQVNAVAADLETTAQLVESLRLSYKSYRLERAKVLYALLNPIFFQKCLESLEGAQMAVENYWAFGSGLFFYRHILGCQVGKYDGKNLGRKRPSFLHQL